MARLDYQQEVRDSVLSLDHLPPLSVTATRLLGVASDPDLEIAALAQIIEQDPALTARILGLANSAFFGQVRPVMNVEQAIIRVLGLNMVRSLALSLALAGSFDSRACRAFDPAAYWLTGLVTANLAAAVGRRLRGDAQRLPDTLYLCGLLHNLGALILTHLRPREMAQVFEASDAAAAGEATELERSLLGVDRWEAGGWLAYRWHLPEVVVHTLGNLGNPDYDGPHGSVIAVVHAARQWALGMSGGAPSTLQIPEVPAEVSAAATEDLLFRLDDLKAMAADLA